MENLKRPAALLNLILIVLLAFLLYRDCEGKDENVTANAVTQDDIKAMKDSHIIPKNDAVNMYKKYTKDRDKLLKKTLKKMYKDSTFEDTRNVWIEIDALRAYIEYLKKDVSETEGLAFYFSVYPSKDSLGKKKNHQTFFIAPTVKNTVGGEVVQSGFTFDKQGNKVFLYKDLDDDPKNDNPVVQEANFFNLLLDHHEDGTLFNEGNPNPPGNNN